MNPLRRAAGGVATVAAPALPLLLALAVFAQVVGFGFVTLDDPAYVSQNPNLAGGLTPAAVLAPAIDTLLPSSSSRPHWPVSGLHAQYSEWLTVS